MTETGRTAPYDAVAPLGQAADVRAAHLDPLRVIRRCVLHTLKQPHDLCTAKPPGGTHAVTATSKC